MSSLRDFLAWFEGFSENLEKAPNTKQWEKVKERVLALKNAPEALLPAQFTILPTVAERMAMKEIAALPADVDPDPRGTTVVRKWKEAVKKALEDMGYDEESASECMADPRFVVDLNCDPAAMAARLVN